MTSVEIHAISGLLPNNQDHLHINNHQEIDIAAQTQKVLKNIDRKHDQSLKIH